MGEKRAFFLSFPSTDKVKEEKRKSCILSPPPPPPPRIMWFHYRKEPEGFKAGSGSSVAVKKLQLPPVCLEALRAGDADDAAAVAELVDVTKT